MTGSYSAIKAQARRDAHSAFAVPVVYYLRGSTTPVQPALGIPLTARLHNKIAIPPDPEGGGYSGILEGVTRVVFNREECALQGIAPKRGDIVQFPDYGTAVTLDTRDPVNGPIVDKWAVAFNR